MRILLAFISPISHALCNIIDNYMTSKLFTNVWTLIFYGEMVGILFLPLLFLFERPDLSPPLMMLPLFGLLALIEVWYLYPYYKALSHDDTSVVASLFSLGKVTVPLFAFLMVGEILTCIQYLGFALIVVASSLLTYDKWAKLKFNKSLFYMLWTSIILSFEVVL